MLLLLEQRPLLSHLKGHTQKCQFHGDASGSKESPVSFDRRPTRRLLTSARPGGDLARSPPALLRRRQDVAVGAASWAEGPEQVFSHSAQWHLSPARPQASLPSTVSV